MDRSWQYPRWKRVALSVLMVFILAATMGLAELVVRHQATVRKSDLADPTRVGEIFFRPPAAWVILPDIKPDELVVQEPGNEDRRARTLILQQVSVEKPTTPEQFVERIRVNHPDFSDWIPADGTAPSQFIDIAGNHGILVALRDNDPGSADGNHKTIWVAATLLTRGKILALQLVCPDDQDAEADKNQFVAVINTFTLSK